MDAGDEDEAALGLRRIVAETPVGPVVARVGGPAAGPATVLVHGAAGSWRGWLPLLRTAARRGRPLLGVVAVDLSGWGESPDPSRPLDLAGAAEAVGAVARAAGAERWIVVGHSLGGLVALAVADREPARTAGVLLVSPTGPAVLAAIRRPLVGGARLPWFAGMLLAMRVLTALPGGGRPLLRALGRAGTLGALAAPLFADRRAVDRSVLEAFGDETRPAAFAAAARAAAGLDLARLSIVCPVRSVRGTRDVFVGRRDAAAFARFPGFAERVVPGAGHFALAERPEAVLAELDDLRRLGASHPCGRMGRRA
ncbi:alpha/beta fold hydrolase [Amnibacterium setariae]|uniref:alpha/beta fold hydrolase n=1 Tax=Amnibacterium setariae TaxID=2306585 RepID=UPI001F3F1F6B|nr:alpha/beta hydrolase [Amnibacterium setariae]